MAKLLFTKKEMSTSNFRKSGAMKKLLKNPKIAKVLDKPRERNELYQEMKKYGAGGLTKNEMAEVLWKFKKSGSDSLDSEETRIIGDVELGSGIGAHARYINPGEASKDGNKSAKIEDKKSEKNKGIENKGNTKPNLKGDAHLASSKSSTSADGNDGAENKDKPNIYEALRNVKHGED